MRTAPNTASRGWHVANWGLWGWIETALKLVTAGAGVAAFLTSPAEAELVVGGNPELLAILMLAGGLLGITGMVTFRFIQREIISILFAIALWIGHAGMLIALLRLHGASPYGIVFALFYILGELAKQRFLAETGYTEGGLSPRSIRMASALLIVIYVVLLILFLI